MSDIDEQIRNALTEEDQKAINEISNTAGLLELIGLTFKGRQAWLNYCMYFLGLVVTAAFVYFVIQYLGTTDIKSSLNWALLIIGCGFTYTILEIVGWQQIQKAELIREIKRLEIRIMLASGKNQR